MGFPLGTSTPQRHRPPLPSNFAPFRTRTPPVRRNASRRFLAMANRHRPGGNEEEGAEVGRRALLVVGLVGSSFLGLGEAVAGDLNAVSFLRERARRERLKESSTPRDGGFRREARTPKIHGGDEATADARTKEVVGRDEAPFYSTDEKGSPETKGRGTAREEIDRVTPLSTQDSIDSSQNAPMSTPDVKDTSSEFSSSPPTVTDTFQETPSLDQNVIEIDEGITSSIHDDVHQDKLPVNPFFSILNTVGIIGSGFLGALYAIAQKDKEATQSTLDSMKSLLEEKETAKILLEKDFERKMLTDKEEHRKHIKKLTEVEAAISNQLTTANATISALGRELRAEKKSLKELNEQIDQLNACIEQASEEKGELESKLKEQTDEMDALQDRVSLLGFKIKDKEKDIEDLTNSFSDKILEREKLNSVLKQTKANYESSCSRVEKLEEEVAMTKNELALKDSKIDELNEKIKSALVERDDVNKNIASLQEEYNSLKMESAKKAKMDSDILSEKDRQLQQLEQKLDITLKEVEGLRASILTITKEKDSFEAFLKEEMESVKHLRDELQITQTNLEASKQESSEILKLLKESREKHEDLNADLSKVQSETSEVQKSLIGSLNESQVACEELSTELATAKEDLDTATQDLIKATDELKVASEAYADLKVELLEALQKYEAITHELQKERETVAKLNEELDGSRRQLGELLESRKSLQSDLSKASASLEEMNNKTSLLSQELNTARSTNMELEKQKEMLQDSMAEQRTATQEALQGIEDAQSAILRLGAERESLVNKNENLTEELASAKGEILLLRRQTNRRNGSAANDNRDTANGGEEPTRSVGTRRSGSRRKRGEHSTQ